MCCLLLDKLLHSAVSRLPHLQNEDNKNHIAEGGILPLMEVFAVVGIFSLCLLKKPKRFITEVITVLIHL